MTIAAETFQQTFVTSIVNLINDAYNCGVLQHHPMTVAGITVEMTMNASFNRLDARLGNRSLSINMYGDDSDAAQYSSIQNLIADLIV